MTDIHKTIRERLRTAHHLLITSHVRPDGDAIGSMLALGLALQNTGKNVVMVLTDGVPVNFRSLPESDLIQKTPEGTFDTIVAVDCSDLKRTGRSLKGFDRPDLVIDHHVTNESFGNINLIEPDAVATASILKRHMTRWGLTITADIASNLLAGLITDTLGFRTSNMTSEVLRQAADLIDLGADMPSLYYDGLVRRTFPAARYWGAGLTSLQKADGIVWGALTLADRKAAGYPGNDDADLINIVSAIDDSEVAILFVEQSSESVKISWRASRPNIDVSKIAVQYAGGGHKAAAGAEVKGTMAEVQQRVLEATKKSLVSTGKGKNRLLVHET